MQHQPLAGIEADAEAPFLPAHLVALDDEARAGRLDDFQRFHVIAEDAAIASGIVAVEHRHVGHAIVVNTQNLGAIEIDHGAQSLDGMGIAVVVLLAAVPTESVRQPPALLVRQPIVAGRPGIDLDILDVDNAAPGQCRAKAGIGPGHLAHQRDVVDQDPRPDAGNVPPVDNLVRDEVDPGFPDLAVGTVEGADERLARKRCAGAKALHHALVRFVQGDGLEHHAGPEIVGRADSRGRTADLARRQRIERMIGRRVRAGLGDGIGHAASLDVRYRRLVQTAGRRQQGKQQKKSHIFRVGGCSNWLAIYRRLLTMPRLP